MLVLRVISWESNGVLPMPQQKTYCVFYGLSDLWASHKQAALPRLHSGVLPSQCFCGSFEAIVFNLPMKGFLNVF